MIHFRSREEQNAIDIRNHQLKMAKVEIQKTKAARVWDEYYLGAQAIKWSGIVLALVVAGATLCGIKPTDLAALKEQNRHSEWMTPSSDKVRDQILVTMAKADSIVKINGWTTNGSQADSQHTNASK